MTDLVHNWIQQHRRLQNFLAASRELKMTPQEKYAYQHHLRNLDLGGVPHPDGSISSFLNMTIEQDGRTYVIPTVWNNQIVSEDQAIQMALQGGLDKWPSYPSEKDASSRYDAMHGYMERDTERKLNANPAAPVSKPAGDLHSGAVGRTEPARTPGVDR